MTEINRETNIETASTNRVALLRDRTVHCCCKYCGSPLEVKKLIFTDIAEAKIEIFCTECNKIEFGVEREIYQSAKFFVEAMEYHHYPELEENEQTKKMNIAKVCEIMSWGNQNLGILNEHGFQVPVAFDETTTGSCLRFDDGILAQWKR